jgi:hypothetical protein
MAVDYTPYAVIAYALVAPAAVLLLTVVPNVANPPVLVVTEVYSVATDAWFAVTPWPLVVTVVYRVAIVAYNAATDCYKVAKSSDVGPDPEAGLTSHCYPIESSVKI